MVRRFVFSLFLFFGVGVWGRSQSSRCEENSKGTTNLIKSFPELSFSPGKSFEVHCSSRRECVSTCQWSTSCHQVALQKNWATPQYKPLKTRLEEVGKPNRLGAVRTQTSGRRQAIRGRQRNANKGRAIRSRGRHQSTGSRQSQKPRDALYSVLGIKKFLSGKFLEKKFHFLCCLVPSRTVAECGWLRTPMRSSGERQRRLSLHQLKTGVFGKGAPSRDAAIRDIIVQESPRGDWQYQVEVCLTKSLPISCADNRDSARKDVSRRNPKRNNNNMNASKKTHIQTGENNSPKLVEPQNQGHSRGAAESTGNQGQGARGGGSEGPVVVEATAIGLGIGYPPLSLP